MSGDCTSCPQLRRQVAELTATVRRQHRLIEFLRRVLAQLIGGVRSTLTFIEQEQDTPTMARRDVPPAIHARLTYVADTAEGQRA
jgi:hypothetical protein